LIKSEDKKFVLGWPLNGVLIIMKNIICKPYIPKHTLETLQIFFSKPHSILDKYAEEAHGLKQALFQL